MSGLAKRSFTLSGHRTSIALEPEFWSALEGLAAARAKTLAGLIAGIDAGRDPADPLASRLRLSALRFAFQLSSSESPRR